MNRTIITIEIAAIVVGGLVTPRVEAQLLGHTAERCALLGFQLVAQPDDRSLICRSFGPPQLPIDSIDPSNGLAPQLQDSIVIERYDEQNRIVSAVGIEVHSDGAMLIKIDEHEYSADSMSISATGQTIRFYLEDGDLHSWLEAGDTESDPPYRSELILLLNTLEAQPLVELF